MGFASQAALDILDKLVIGTLILIIGMFVNRSFENYKARSAFISGYTEKHIGAIAEAWQLMYSWEDFVRRSFRRQGIFTDEQWHAWMDDLAEAIKESQRRELALQSFVESNRFWLGEHLYACLVMYHNELDSYVRAVLWDRRGDFEVIHRALTARKQDIMTLLRVNRTEMY